MIHLCLLTQKLESSYLYKERYKPLPGNTYPKLENKSIPLPSYTQQNSYDTNLPTNKTIREYVGNMTAYKIYTNLIHKVFDYSLIPSFKYGYNI